MSAEFIAEFRKLLPFFTDSYIQANLRIALDRYEKDNMPTQKVFVRDPRNLCVHGEPLGADCGPCIESYGNAQPVMGEWIEQPRAKQPTAAAPQPSRGPDETKSSHSAYPAPKQPLGPER